MASIHPRRNKSQGKLAGIVDFSPIVLDEDEVPEGMQPHQPIISAASSSAGGKDYQEDMAVKIDDFNHVIKKEAKKTFNGAFDVRRSFYAIFDGHGGARCSKFLAENFHVMLARHPLLEEQPDEALHQVWAHSEERFLDICSKKYRQSRNDGQGMAFHRSGSTATVALVIGDLIYVANCGDSHAYLYQHNGKHPKRLSDDHNTDNPAECERVRRTGATVEQETILVSKGCFKVEKVQVGKLRVWPGGLAVTRSFGDYAAKLEALGGVKDAILSDYEELRRVNVDAKCLGLILASDGVWDGLPANKVWDIFTSELVERPLRDRQERVMAAIETVIHESCESEFWKRERCSADNATAIALVFALPSNPKEPGMSAAEDSESLEEPVSPLSPDLVGGVSGSIATGEENSSTVAVSRDEDTQGSAASGTHHPPSGRARRSHRRRPTEKKTVTFAVDS